jgi:HD-GYP domain-containing protein (c-di-GMP phosphodiesterase class II)
MFHLTDDLLDRYDYATDPLLRAGLHAWDRTYMGAMMSYGRGFSNFGRQMMAHQNRVAKDGARFLRHLGYSERAARNFRAAMLFHDIGKTHTSYHPGLWTLDERPTPEEKEAQKRHARLGGEMFESLAAKIPALRQHPHFLTRHAVTLYHHERIDGTGPEGESVTSLPVFVRVSCIVDAYDGDRIQRPHQKKRRTPREALRRLAGEDGSTKYSGAFDDILLSDYIKFKKSELS